jgi:lysyl-tRNA synthetase class 2
MERLREALLALTGAPQLRWRDKTCDPRRGAGSGSPWPRRSGRHAGVDILATVGHARTGCRAPPASPMHAERFVGRVFFRIMFDKIEAPARHGRPTILCEYPIGMAALARAKPGDARGRRALRALLLRRRTRQCLRRADRSRDPVDRALPATWTRKSGSYGVRWPIDADFLAALEHGLPDCAGIALGFDRLVMLATGASHIEDVLWLPVKVGPGKLRIGQADSGRHAAVVGGLPSR